MAYELQHSFAAGEISPKNYLRNDGNKASMHAAGVKTMLNIIPDPHGTAESRLGFDFIDEILLYNNIRMFTFSVNSAEAYAIVITDGALYVFDEDGYVLQGQLIVDNLFFFGAVGWNLNDASLKLNYIAIELAGTIYTNVVISNTSTQHQIRVYGSNERSEENEFASIRILIGTTPGGNEIADSGSIVGAKSVYEFNHVAGLTDFYVTVNALSGVKDVRKVECYEGFNPSRVAFAVGYNKYELSILDAEMAPGEKTLYIVGRTTVPPKILRLSQGDFGFASLWTFIDVPFVFDVNGSPWGTKYPGNIGFFDGRMILGGTDLKPTTIWGSKPNNYFDFDFGTALADDAINLPLAKNGSIHWIESSKKLLVGLDTGEHLIFASGALTPSNAQTEQQSGYGSTRIRAVIVGEEIAYVDPSGTKVRLMNFVRDEEGWSSYDISFQSEHITSEIIDEMKFGHSPIGRFIFKTFDGQLVLANFERDQGTIGWYRFNTNGKILSTTLIKKNGKDNLWIAVVRGGKLFIEKQATNINSTHHMDSALTFILGVGFTATVFFGYGHLIGQTVQVIADGLILPDVVVAANGTVTIPTPAKSITVGLGYSRKLVTLQRLDNNQSGNTIAHSKRWSNIIVSLINSSRPIVNGNDTFLRFPTTLMEIRESNKTEYIELPLLGWDQEAGITIEQDLPLPLNIAGVGGKLKNNKL